MTRVVHFTPPIFVGMCIALMLALAAYNNSQHNKFKTPAASIQISQTDPMLSISVSPRDEHNAKEDLTLEAQQGQTFWAKISALVAMGALIVTVLGLYLVKKTLDATRQAVEKAAESNRISQQTALSERRAWIKIDDVKFVYPTAFAHDGFRYRISYKAENIRKSLARNLEVRIETFFGRDNDEPFMVARDRFVNQARNQPVELGTIIFPGQQLEGSLLFSDGREKFAKAITQRPDGIFKFEIDIFITASYRIDGDDKPHVTQMVYSRLNTPVPYEVPETSFALLYEMPFLSPVID